MNTLQKDADHSLRTLVKWQRLTAPGGAKEDAMRSDLLFRLRSLSRGKRVAFISSNL